MKVQDPANKRYIIIDSRCVQRHLSGEVSNRNAYKMPLYFLGGDLVDVDAAIPVAGLPIFK